MTNLGDNADFNTNMLPYNNIRVKQVLVYLTMTRSLLIFWHTHVESRRLGCVVEGARTSLFAFLGAAAN